MMREFKQGDEVSVALPGGALETGWRVFMINQEAGVAVLTREVGSEIESKKVPLADLR